MNRCDVEVGEMEELITLDVLNHYLYKVLETLIQIITSSSWSCLLQSFNSSSATLLSQPLQGSHVIMVMIHHYWYDQTHYCFHPPWFTASQGNANFSSMRFLVVGGGGIFTLHCVEENITPEHADNFS